MLFFSLALFRLYEREYTRTKKKFLPLFNASEQQVLKAFLCRFQLSSHSHCEIYINAYISAST